MSDLWLGNQRRVLEEFLRRLRPHWRRDRALPERIERMLRGDRRCGSRDRRLYRELIYTAIRHLPLIEPLLDRAPDRAVEAIARLAADTPATRGFRAEFAVPGPIGGIPPPLLPAWFADECPGAFVAPNYDVLNARAPLWLRLQAPVPGPVLDEFSRRGWRWRRSELLPAAVEIMDEADVTATDAHRRGWVEIQDIGSQMVLDSIGIEPGGHWLDACAGGGGKTLQLAGLLGQAGRVDAHDVRPSALDELDRRAARAGLADRITRVRTPAGPYDGVLVDAPCSGTGTWRRFPHLKWVTTPGDVRTSSRLQLELLEKFAPLVRPGGRLAYATCSLCRTENEAVVSQFLAENGSFAPALFARTFGGEPRGPGLLFWPATHNGDGFFVASLKKT